MFTKSLLATFTTVFASAALAYPNVGDKVSWTGTLSTVNGETNAVKITKEVIGHDEKKNSWKIKIEAVVGTDTSSETIEISDLYSPEKYKALIADCEKNGGTLEKLSAPAGTYDTCKMSMTMADGTLVERWWGDIPFGVVSKNTRDSGKMPISKPDLNSIIAGL
ncbi:hypothetical protein AB1A81_10615 [Bdellovibrio bacteriovorus]|uniref:Uncharacterized protein n=1 Tax=Bdellovibrio bacteriovorus (strain ATCC 15356 / DSM 50701 / NCIMB 9529 / HD100) TaxID=264462 RepID=Q6MKR8_BDEBA|nr:hypothetical protein [Bdellovibrio bacteriovorus]AHZ84848.1 hypothetical protein EP01_07850 [Bdellovibrio bacteriovorus]BEV68734.1 hypothetical protein Bb109J_c2154 [Bdellovibrio bacteriovorus]CAE80139.1 hypothetical protein predicted by Glimmer/Critica [Bdellovibrio bacteriovorus HD100]